MIRFRVLLLLAVFALDGCYARARLSHYLSEMQVKREEMLVERLTVPPLHRFAPSLHVGSADCSARRSHYPFFKICSLAINRREVPVALFYDEDRKRTVARILWPIVSNRDLSIEVAAAAWQEYGVRGGASCGRTVTLVLVPNSHASCLFRYRGTARNVRLDVGAWPYRYVDVDTIRGFALLPHAATVKARLADELRRHPHVVSGSAIADDFELVDGPLLRYFLRRYRLTRLGCLKVVDVASGTDRCWMGTNAGYFYETPFLGTDRRVHFRALSTTVDLQREARDGEAEAERLLGAQGLRITASADCGPQRYRVLTAPGVRYCSLALSNGLRMRMGVEFYDPSQGVDLVFERLPGSTTQ